MGGVNLQYRFYINDVKAAVKSQAFRIRFKGMSVQINGQQDLVFEFFDVKARDEVSALSDAAWRFCVLMSRSSDNGQD